MSKIIMPTNRIYFRIGPTLDKESGKNKYINKTKQKAVNALVKFDRLTIEDKI